MKTLTIQTENMDDMLKVVDAVRKFIGAKIRNIKIDEEEESAK
jgi:hypothetical protein